ncbi:MAG: bacteriohemerythrin [Desulfobulbaceae bacterium]|nr:bacteriohemerythrin [Desulfobulbaceae bacterium]HIJ78429.1 bacteriohemerythrin [Deltaproteobacteria bacterium]
MVEKLGVWREEYRVGIERIDRQHKILFCNIKLLEEAISRQDFSAIPYLLDMLEIYFKEHFREEEIYLKEFPGFEVHNRKHWDFLGEVLKFIRKYQAGSRDLPALATEIHDFLYSWLQDHILTTDKKELSQVVIGS